MTYEALTSDYALSAERPLAHHHPWRVLPHHF